MPILEPLPVARQRCERCLGEHPQRWIVTLERPADAWSECTACDRITIWRHGIVECPPVAAGLPVPAGAIAAVVTAAERERAEVLARVAALREELARAEEDLARRTAFIDRFRWYQRRADGCGEIADKL